MSVALVIVTLKFNEILHRLMNYDYKMNYFSMKNKMPWKDSVKVSCLMKIAVKLEMGKKMEYLETVIKI